jgi:hypothetical protein
VFDDEQTPTTRPPDYTGLKIVGVLTPVFFLFVYLGKPEMGFTVMIVLGMIMIAVYLRWRLRKRLWFWATIAFILLLHIPLFFIVRWPDSKIPTIAYSMPIGIVDFLLISGAIGLAERIFSKGSLSDDEDE